MIEKELNKRQFHSDRELVCLKNTKLYMFSDVNCLYCLRSDVNLFHGGLPVSPAGQYMVGTEAQGRSLRP